MNAIKESFLNKISLFGGVSFLLAIIIILFAFVFHAGKGYTSSQDDAMSFLLSWWPIVLITLVMVPLNIFSTFAKRRNVLAVLFILIGILLALQVRGDAVRLYNQCQVNPELVYCANYDFSVGKVFVPMAFGLGGLIFGILGFLFSPFAKVVDILQRIAISSVFLLIYLLALGHILTQ